MNILVSSLWDAFQNHDKTRIELEDQREIWKVSLKHETKLELVEICHRYLTQIELSDLSFQECALTTTSVLEYDK